MSRLPYYGPIGMVDSRFAPPQRRKQVEALLAAKPELQARKDAEKIFVMRDEAAVMAASNAVRTQGVGVQLSHAQGRVLEQEIAQHKHDVAQAVTTAVAKTHQILNLIREAVKLERPNTADVSLKVVESLQQEMDKLLSTAQQAQDALPNFFKKQEENSELVASARIHQAQQDIQEELDQKDKKNMLEQDLVYGQQQAPKDVDSDANHKNTELQERLSRLNLELGLVRTQLDSQNVQVAKAKAAENDASKILEVMEQKLETLNYSKESLSAENENIRGDIKGLEVKLKAAEDQARGDTQDYEKQLLNLRDQLRKEQQKAASLDSHLQTLRHADETSRREVDKVKAESKLLSEKYNNQTGAYAKMSKEFKEQTKKVTTLDDEVCALQQQKIELEKAHKRATFLKDSLQKQHEAAKSELDDLKQKIIITKEEAHQLSAKLKQVEGENKKLEAESKDLRAKQSEHNKTVATLKKSDAEVATLRATVQSLQEKPTAMNESVDVAVAALKQELQGLNEKLSQSETNRAEWEQLGRKAMIQYRDMVPKYRQLEGIEKQLQHVLVENQQLKVKGTSGTNSDAKYWRDKYNELLAETEN